MEYKTIWAYSSVKETRQAGSWLDDYDICGSGSWCGLGYWRDFEERLRDSLRFDYCWMRIQESFSDWLPDPVDERPCYFANQPNSRDGLQKWLFSSPFQREGLQTWLFSSPFQIGAMKCQRGKRLLCVVIKLLAMSCSLLLPSWDLLSILQGRKLDPFEGLQGMYVVFVISLMCAFAAAAGARLIRNTPELWALHRCYVILTLLFLVSALSILAYVLFLKTFRLATPLIKSWLTDAGLTSYPKSVINKISLVFA